MRTWLTILCLTMCLGMARAQVQPLTSYHFKFTVKGLKDTVCYLGFHFGDKKYLKDTATVNSNGEFEFKGKDTLYGGIYLVVLPNKKYFEFVVNEPKVHLTTDTNNFVGSMKVIESKENQLWFDYLRYMETKSKAIEELKESQKDLDEKSKEYKAIQEKMDAVGKEIITYRSNIQNQHAGTFVSALFNAMREIEVPEPPTKLDSLFKYRYYRTHYFDYLNLNDHRLLRTPIFETKFNYYFDKVVPQSPDSIIAEADALIAKVKDREMYKFVVHTLTVNFERSQIMCMDRVFVHMVEKYYNSGKAFWTDKKTLDKMKERAEKLKPLLCGEIVPNVILPDTTMKWQSLYALKNDITILYFWQATCGHCKKATPQLKEIYDRFLKPNNIQIFGVEGELEDTEWKKFMQEHKLNWINVSDNPEINKNPEKYIHLTDLPSLNFRLTYDLYSYPVIYVLDKDKRIVGKRLGVEQLEDFLKKYMEQKKMKIVNP